MSSSVVGSAPASPAKVRVVARRKSPFIQASIPVLRWAADRARLDEMALAKRFRKWPLWLAGRAHPTLKQLETFARLSHTPFGFFFLPEPPRVELPVPDFRTLRDAPLREPSADLLETLYLCQQRQDWFHEYAQILDIHPLDLDHCTTTPIGPLGSMYSFNSLNVSLTVPSGSHACTAWGKPKS